MTTVSFAVRGSAAEPYLVTFHLAQGTLAAFCTCPAGDQGQACKHRLSILAGDTSGIVDVDPEAVTAVRSAMVGTPLAAALLSLAQAEAEAAAAKADVTAAKKQVAAAMRGQ